MQIQQIHVEGFGTLSNTRLSPLGSGLTILYGNNGTGKTTVLEFVRGVLCGFNHSRRLRLLPPIKEGTPGGSLTIQTSQGEFDIIRHARADSSDTLAILQQQGSKRREQHLSMDETLLSASGSVTGFVRDSQNDVSQLRQTIQGLDEQTIRTLFMVSGYDALNLNRMAQLAQRYGIELQTQRSSATWISPRIEELQTERSALYDTASSQGELARLHLRREQLTNSVQNLRQIQLKAITEWRNAIEELKLRLDRLRRESNWLIQEQGAVESDLTEVQTRLWSRRETIVEEQETVEQVVPKPPAQWKAEIAEIDREIANAQQVLRDLAGSRMEISVTKAGLAGAETPDAEVTFDRQRSALSAMEVQTDTLLKLASQLKTTSECLCGARSESLEQVTQELRSQIWFLCQELSRQQTAQRQWVLQTQREGVDGCEQELTRQIRRLRIRRDELLQRHTSGTSEQIHFRTRHESEWCQCEGHDQAIQQTDIEPEFTTKTEIVTRTRTVITSAARPGDAELERGLKERLGQLFQQSQQALSRLRELEAELSRLQRTPPELPEDHTIQNLRNELELVNQQLAEGRRNWHSLKWTETILGQTQSRLHVEVIPTVIQEASALLSKMTSGRSTGVRFDADESEMKVISATGESLPALALSRGTLEQASLCFRIALAREFHRRGHRLPLVLDDVLVDSDENRSRAAIEVLVDAARSQQILFLTCQEHLLDLFDEYHVSILEFPGSPRPGRREESVTTHVSAGFVLNSLASSPVTPVVPRSPAPVPVPKSTDSGLSSLSANEKPLEVKRVQPDQPFWLGVSSPLTLVPSLGSQMVRRLGTIGVRDVGDLIELDLDNQEIPLDGLQISAATLRQWQAEALLLCCVPYLTGRDAQLLALCGIQSASELSQIDLRELTNRVHRLRGDSKFSLALSWLADREEWPTQEQMANWIQYSQQSRSWKKLQEGRVRSAHSARRIVHPGTEQNGNHRGSNRNRVPAPHVRMHEQRTMTPIATTAEKELRFYLHTDSPIVDAPSIGPRTAERLNAIGIHLVSDLLERSAKEIAMELGRREVTTDVVTSWQRQALLVCRVPFLRGHDAQVLVACEILDAKALAGQTPQVLFKKIEPFVHSREGQRLLRSAKTPDLEEVTEWVESARLSPSLRAA